MSQLTFGGILEKAFKTPEPSSPDPLQDAPSRRVDLLYFAKNVLLSNVKGLVRVGFICTKCSNFTKLNKNPTDPECSDLICSRMCGNEYRIMLKDFNTVDMFKFNQHFKTVFLGFDTIEKVTRIKDMAGNSYLTVVLMNSSERAEAFSKFVECQRERMKKDVY